MAANLQLQSGAWTFPTIALHTVPQVSLDPISLGLHLLENS